jgi:serine O-acetyltransferase
MDYPNKYSLKKYLARDWRNLQIFMSNDFVKFKFRYFMHPRFLPVVIIRLSNFLYRKKFHTTAHVFQYLNIILFGIEVPAKLNIGSGLVLAHTVGTVLGAQYIGENVTIYHQVTIGSKNIKNSQNESRPAIMDNVVLYAGSKILGSITIGKNSIVGANSVVLKNVPDNHIAYGIPAKSNKICEKNH